MTKNIHPNSYRIQISNTWSSIWYNKLPNYTSIVHEDLQIQKYIKNSLYNEGWACDKIIIYRTIHNKIYIQMFLWPIKLINYSTPKNPKSQIIKQLQRFYTQKKILNHILKPLSKWINKQILSNIKLSTNIIYSPEYISLFIKHYIEQGNLIQPPKKNLNLILTTLKKKQTKKILRLKTPINSLIKEYEPKNYNISAKIWTFNKILSTINNQLIQGYKNLDISGFKILLSGRLKGSFVKKASKSYYWFGQLPLTSINSNIVYSQKTAYTKYGSVGIKVWINYNKKIQPTLKLKIK